MNHQLIMDIHNRIKQGYVLAKSPTNVYTLMPTIPFWDSTAIPIEIDAESAEYFLNTNVIRQLIPTRKFELLGYLDLGLPNDGSSYYCFRN